MPKRPLALSIIGWWMVISAVFGLYSIVTMGSNPMVLRMLEQMHVSLAFQQAIAAVGMVVALASAYGLFKGQPWSRLLYVGWNIVGLCIALVTSPIKSLIIFSVLIVAVIAYFLFRAEADRYFAASAFQLRRTGAQ